MAKVVKFNGISLELVSRIEAAKILGISRNTFDKWEAKGILLPPSFQDESVKTFNFGREPACLKFYSKHEIFMVKSIMRNYKFRKGLKLQESFIEQVKEGMATVRQLINEAHPAVMDYPLILEFSSANELRQYFMKVFEGCRPAYSDEEIDFDKACQQAYLSGSKFIAKEK